MKAYTSNVGHSFIPLMLLYPIWSVHRFQGLFYIGEGNVKAYAEFVISGAVPNEKVELILLLYTKNCREDVIWKTCTYISDNYDICVCSWMFLLNIPGPMGARVLGPDPMPRVVGPVPPPNFWNCGVPAPLPLERIFFYMFNIQPVS